MFMQPQIVYGRWIEVDGPCGTDAIPFDAVYSNPMKKAAHPTFSGVKDYTQNCEAWSIVVRDGFGARLSAPGYMDATEWSVFETEDEARAYLRDTHEIAEDYLP